MKLAEPLAELTRCMEAIEIRKAAQALRAIWALGNEYLAEAAPWTVIKTDRERAGVIVRAALNLAALFAQVSAPFIPFTAAVIAEALGRGTPDAWPADLKAALSQVAPGTAVRAPEVLFRKIDDAQLAQWAERFGGG